MKLAWALVVLCLIATPALADVAGEWSGDLQFPEGKVRLVLHISGTDENLSATADSPDQNVKDLIVDSITRNDEKIAFNMKDIRARFAGEISGDQIRGTFRQDGRELTLTLARTGGPKRAVDQARDSGEQVDVAGNWAGSLEFPEATLRLVLHVTKGPEGKLIASVDSPDQNLTGLTVDSVTTSGQILRFVMKDLAARFEGRVSSNEIRGILTQSGREISLTLRRN